MEVKDKCFCVTGGASGLGREISLKLLSDGACLVILDSDEEALSRLPSSEKITLIPCDLTDQNHIERSLDGLFRRHPKVHGLINNAGVMHNEPLLNINTKDRRHSLRSWKRVLDINLTAPFVLAGYFAEHMVLNRLRGIIVNISSVSARGNIGQSAYSAAKAGLESITKVWAKELGPMGVRCVAIAPGFMDSESTNAILHPELLDKIKDTVPLRRLGQPSECADIVYAIICNDYVNGCVIPVDGGIQI